MMSNFNYQRVLIILPERLGDALFHTPAIRLLKSERPNLFLGVIALSPLCAEILQNNPFINSVHIEPSSEDLKRLSNTYDVVLLLHPHTAAKECAAIIALPTINMEKFVAGSRHRSQNSYDFICKLLNVTNPQVSSCYTLFPNEDNQAHVKDLFNSSTVSKTDILIGCHIGCHSIAKRGWKFWKPLAHPKVWPVDNFIALAIELRKIDSRFRFVLTGSKSENNLGEKFEHAVPSTINLIDRTSVLDLAELMRHLQLFISSDTGALHVACATNVGLIALFGPTALTSTGPHPMQPYYTILQSPRIEEIAIANVISAVLDHPNIAASRQIEQRKTS